MASFVLVHGSWHGGWCWGRVASLLRARQHRVATPDLPGRGSDTTPAEDITLRHYADRIGEVLDCMAEPAILVGHSRGGIVISQVAEDRPEGVRLLVYLAAFLYAAGEDMQADRPENDGSLIPAALLRNAGVDWLRRDAIRAALHGQTPAADASWAAARLVPEPIGPVRRPLALTAGRFGRIPRVYIECLHDRAVPLPLQRQMQRALSCARVISMATDHSPFLSAPGLLAAHLNALAGGV